MIYMEERGEDLGFRVYIEVIYMGGYRDEK